MPTYVNRIGNPKATRENGIKSKGYLIVVGREHSDIYDREKNVIHRKI